MGRLVRILHGMSGEISLFGDVLILGDRTSAYCVVRESELSRGGISERKLKQNAELIFISNPGLVQPPELFLTRQKTLPGGVAPTTGSF